MPISPTTLSLPLLSSHLLPTAILSFLSLLVLTPLIAPKPPKRDVLLAQGAADSGKKGKKVAMEECVLILGASEGVGRGLAEEYVLKRKARVILVARTLTTLLSLRDHLIFLAIKAHGYTQEHAEDRIIVEAGDIAKGEDMVRVRARCIAEWGKLDTLHIISGLPSTQTIYQGVGLELVPNPAAQSTATGQVVEKENEAVSRVQERVGKSYIFTEAPSSESPITSAAGSTMKAAGPSVEQLQNFQDEARRLMEVNCVAVGLVVGCFLPLLSSTSSAPLIHHLSSVAALIPAPTRCLYAASKGGGLALFRTAGVECEREGGGSGVRFLAICPGTIDTGFRRKSSSAQSNPNGLDKKLEGMEAVGRVLTVQDTVDFIIHHSSLSPLPSPIEFSLPLPFLGNIKLALPFVTAPPADLLFLPEFPYRAAWHIGDLRGLVGIVSRSGRKKYGLV